MVKVKVEGSSQECRKWLGDCLNVFPAVKRMRIEIACTYKALPEGVLARTRGRVDLDRDVDAESLLLSGVSKVKQRRTLNKSFLIEVNSAMKGIEKVELRAQVVKNVLVHELMHVERKDLLELSKSYQRRRRKKVHAGLEKDAFERYNQLRALEGLPRIGDRRDLETAVMKVFEHLG
ncbi:MAG: hypothetical protein JRN58_04575 [Nitrososphaerota archaeon]|nr:hypothetical protein [Nitrososphaerota archaeon]